MNLRASRRRGRTSGPDLPENVRWQLSSTAFSPDGRWLAVAGEKRLAVWDLANHTPGTRLQPDLGPGVRIFFSADGELFASGEWVEQAWAHVMPIIDTWAAAEPVGFPNYEAGTWGPQEADVLLARDGRVWRRL